MTEPRRWPDDADGRRDTRLADELDAALTAMRQEHIAALRVLMERERSGRTLDAAEVAECFELERLLGMFHVERES